MGQTPSEEIQRVARLLVIDAYSYEACEALRKAGVDCILLKGRSLVEWLYPSSSLREYSDCDLLVAPGKVDVAEAVLTTLGFTLSPIHDDTSFSGSERTWDRLSDGAVVDLHWNLVGAEAAPDVVWDVLKGYRRPMRLGSGTVDIFLPEALAVHVVLHAAQHGTELPHPREDLVRLLAVVEADLWPRIYSVASEICALEAFAAGLRILPAGDEVADELRLPKDFSADVVLRAEGAPPMALSLEWFSNQKGARRKFLIVAKNLFPSTAFMKEWDRRADDGPVWLAWAYLRRPFVLLGQALPALLVLMRVRKRAHRERRS